MFGGAYLGERGTMRQGGFKPMVPPSLAKLKSVYKTVLVLGVLGILFRSLDWFFLRGITFNNSSFENRELLEEAGTNIFSMMSLILAPLVLAALILRFLAKKMGHDIGTRLDLILCLVWPIFNVAIGARSTALLFVFVFTILFIHFQRKLKISSIIAFAIFMALIFAGINIVFLTRLEEMGIDYLTVSQFSGYTQTIPLSPKFLIYLAQTDGFYAKFLFMASHYSQYYLHGYFEAILIISEYSGDHQYGKYQFFFLFKLLGMLLGQPLSAEAVTEGLPRIGTYDTFFGSAFVDFSYAMIIFGAVFGFLCGSAWRRFKSGDLFIFPLVMMFSYILFLVPIVNGFIFSGGLYYLLSFFLVKIISWFKI